MNRIEIERTLNTDRIWLLEQLSALALEDLTRPLTPSENDPAMLWSAQDHLLHLSGIENNFNEIFRRHFAGEAVPIGLAAKPDGTGRSRDEMLAGLSTRSEPWVAEVMQSVHKGNDAWLTKHRHLSFDGVVALGEQVRAETLAILAGASEAQLQEMLPGAPWADGTVGGVMANHGGHGRRHWAIVQAALEKK